MDNPINVVSFPIDKFLVDSKKQIAHGQDHALCLSLTDKITEKPVMPAYQFGVSHTADRP